MSTCINCKMTHEFMDPKFCSQACREEYTMNVLPQKSRRGISTTPSTKLEVVRALMSTKRHLINETRGIVSGEEAYGYIQKCINQMQSVIDEVATVDRELT